MAPPSGYACDNLEKWRNPLQIVNLPYSSGGRWRIGASQMMPVAPLRDISYESIQRHRAHVHHTLRDPETLTPVNFVDMFDAGAYMTKRQKTKPSMCEKEKIMMSKNCTKE